MIRAILKLTTKELQVDSLKKVFDTLNVNLAQNVLVSYMDKYEDDETNEESTKADITDIINLLKLGLYGRLSEKAVDIIENFLKEICDKNARVLNITN